MAHITIEAEIGGVVCKIEAREGCDVEENDVVVYIESMKMELPLSAPNKGVITKLLVAEGDMVTEGQAIAILVTE